MKKLILPSLVLICGLSVSLSAAFYSVSGLMKLFSSAALAVGIMAGTLEVSKLVVTAYLHKYWKKVGLGIKTYLTTAVLILMFITSLGIYGFLSSSYQDTINKFELHEKNMQALDVKIELLDERKDGYTDEKTQLNTSIRDLRDALGNNVIQYKDKETGEIITTSSSRNRRAYEKQLEIALERDDAINEKVEELDSKILALEEEKLDMSSNLEVANEIGPLKYLSEITGMSMSRVINYFILLLVVVFDPLAIMMLVASQRAFELIEGKEEPKKKKKMRLFKWFKKKKESHSEHLYEEPNLSILKESEDDGFWTEEEMRDFNEQFNADDALPDEEEEKPKKEFKKPRKPRPGIKQSRF